MLEFIRKHSNSIVVKIFLTILALTFVLFFGVSDVIRRLTGKDYVVKAGNCKISPAMLKNEKIKRISATPNRAADTDDKELTMSVMHQLIWESIIKQFSKDFGIAVSDETVKRYIGGMTLFRDKNGCFDAGMLRGFLQKINVSEAAFLESSRRDIREAMIRASFLYVSTAAGSEGFVQANLEKRIVSLVRLTPSSFSIRETPSEEVLKEFHAANPDLFATQEIRSFRVLELSESSVAQNVTVSEEEIREAYEVSAEKEERSFDDMKRGLADNLKQEKVQSEINDLTRRIEDALMAGEDIAETAKQFNLKVMTFKKVKADGKDEKSRPALKNLSYGDDVIAIAFSIDEGTDSSFSEALDNKKNKVYWSV
ncbi:MAG: SurA N-terminal domain-containing protein, partial [Holosporaceae bacterium]|nr:SurA N-terminal domain-containing protein [Holosporaceae bacterium]